MAGSLEFLKPRGRRAEAPDLGVLSSRKLVCVASGVSQSTPSGVSSHLGRVSNKLKTGFGEPYGYVKVRPLSS